MFSQFFSPVQKVKPSPRVIREIEEEEYILNLAPFTNLPKICFDNILLGTTSRKTLIVRNSTPTNIQIIVTRVPPSERQLQLSWYEEIIQSNEDINLELQWTPDCEGSWRDTITFQDGGRLKKDISVNFKCIRLKKAKQPSKPKQLSKPKPAVICSKVKSPLRRKISPTKKTSLTTVSKKDLPHLTNRPTIVVTSSYESLNTYSQNKTANINDVKHDKENVFDITHTQFNSNNISMGNISFGLPKSVMKSPLSHLSCDSFEDSLETPRKYLSNITETMEDKMNQFAITPIFRPPKSHVVKGNIVEEVNVGDTFTKNESLNGALGDTYIKMNISSSTQIKDTSVDLTSPKSTITNCNLSPIGNSHINNETFEMSGKPKNRLELIIEETSNESLISNYKNSFSNVKKRGISPKSRFTKTKPLNLKAFFEKSNIKTEKRINSSSHLREAVIKLHDPETFMKPQRDPLVLAATTALDPFISASLYYNLEWMDEQEKSFKKLLNALLTPPADLNSDTSIQIDVGKLWNDCKKREITIAPSREVISNHYHVKTRLDSLRKAAFKFITSPNISEVLSKVCAVVDNNKLQMRADKDVHLDLCLQAEIMALFVSYNPLWLRIGLETVYGITIPLHSNSDIMGLSVFISEHFFRDAFLIKKYKTVHNQKYGCYIKKFILKKFLILIYFLDQAKITRLIPHDPCLFSKKALYKESREVLLRFSREVLFAVGDVTKFLRHFGYVLTHKQTYIHEFDYAVTDLGTDLRDGVRLTRVMEIILLTDKLIENLRVPANSRLQKIHNVKLSFDALIKAGFTILHDIQPKDIVEGHKEKTLSFLWQIIYKFEAPRLQKAVITIQNWWRSLFITVKRNILRKFRQKQLESAIKIQRWYRRICLARIYENLIPIVKKMLVERQIENAAVKIQSVLKMVIQRKKYINLRKLVSCLQSYSRRWLIQQQVQNKISSVIKIQAFYRMYQQKKKYLKLKKNVLVVEELYLAKKLMLQIRSNYLLLKTTILFVEQKHLANKKMEYERENYLKLKHFTLIIQQKYRATKEMKCARQHFLELKNSALIIQRRHRANKTMQKIQNDYIELQRCTILVQRQFRANVQREKYLNLRKSSVIIQRRLRATQQMLHAKRSFLTLKNSVLAVQRRYRANKTMQKIRIDYIKLQRASIFIQRRFRANHLMKTQREEYLNLRKSCIIIQRRFHATKQMLHVRKSFSALKDSVLVIQRRFRANKTMQKVRNDYVKLQRSTIFIQRQYRANRLMKTQRELYLNLRKSCIIVQRRFRAKKQMLLARKSFQTLKDSVLAVQRRYRANKTMQRIRSDYIKLQTSTIFIQRQFRANHLMKTQREEYLNLGKSCIIIQRRFRAKKQMLLARKSFLSLKDSVLAVQRRYRANKTMQNIRNDYVKLQRSTIFIQRQFRANRLMKTHREEYLNLRKSCIIIQRRFRAKKQMLLARKSFQTLKDSVLAVQRRYTANKTMQRIRSDYIKLQRSTIFIQRQFRANHLMNTQREEYLSLRKSCIIFQRRFRAKKQMLLARKSFLTLKDSVLAIQRRYRANKTMQKIRNGYIKLQSSTIFIQRQFRANRLMKTQREEYLNLRKSCIIIQRRFRATKQMLYAQKSFLALKNSVLTIQRKYRANKSMKKARTNYTKLKTSIIYIQRKFYANRLMKDQREKYLKLKKSSVIIQRKLRGYLLMRSLRKEYLETLQSLKKSVRLIEHKYLAKRQMVQMQGKYKQLREVTVFIQQKYRANKLMKIDRDRYLNLKRAVLTIENRILAKNQRKCFENIKKAMINIQCHYRGNVARTLFLEMKNQRDRRKLTFVRLQARIRGYLMRSKFRKQFGPEVMAEKKRKMLETKAATAIQARWRGYRTRSLQDEHMTNIRKRLNIANINWTVHETMLFRKQRAIFNLTSKFCSARELSALRQLDFDSRVSKMTCIELSTILPDILYPIISDATRSEPEIYTLIYSTSILINICKIPECRDNAWQPSYIDALVTKMLHWSDKNNSLFVHLCTLLWIFSHNNKYKRVIKGIPYFEQRFIKIRTHCERKQKMMFKYNGCTVNFFGPWKGLPLPTLEPDWGIDYANKPRTFKNSVQAIKCLINILQK